MTNNSFAVFKLKNRPLNQQMSQITEFTSLQASSINHTKINARLIKQVSHNFSAIIILNTLNQCVIKKLNFWLFELNWYVKQILNTFILI